MLWSKLRKAIKVDQAKPIRVPEPYSRHLPEADRSRPWENLEDKRIVVAGRHGITVVDAQRVIDSGLWHEVQYAKWDPKTCAFTLVWIQPGRPGLVAATLSEDPKRFMETVTSRVTDTIVATRSFFTPEGTRVSASVRRRVDGQLFQTLIADGSLTEDDETKARQVARDLAEEFNVED